MLAEQIDNVIYSVLERAGLSDSMNGAITDDNVRLMFILVFSLSDTLLTEEEKSTIKSWLRESVKAAIE